MAEVIFKALTTVVFCTTATLVTSTVFAIFKAADALERIADALEERQGDDEEGGEE